MADKLAMVHLWQTILKATVDMIPAPAEGGWIACRRASKIVSPGDLFRPSSTDPLEDNKGTPQKSHLSEFDGVPFWSETQDAIQLHCTIYIGGCDRPIR
jgi:hypothetical protein